jgi:transposase
MSTLFGLFPFLLKLYADSGYQGAKFRQGVKRVCEQINVEIVKRSDAGKFVVLPKRWIVERTIPGSTDAGGWPRIGNASIETVSRFCVGHPSG